VISGLERPGLKIGNCKMESNYSGWHNLEGEMVKLENWRKNNW
jgi:hypothetical protein